MYVVTGVTGNVGSVAAETLLAQGKKVRAVVRDRDKGEAWQGKGAEVVVVADWNDRPALTRALSGSDGAFLLLPPIRNIEDPIASNRSLADTLAGAVEDARVPHVVFLSSFGAQHAEGTGPVKMVHYGEIKLRQAAAAVTAIRAAYFMENHASALATVANGVVPTFQDPELVFPHVATRDIGIQVARSLAEGGRHGHQIVELRGPKDYSVSEVAAELSKLVGRPLQVVQHPLAEVEPAFRGFGFSPKMAALYREMFEGLAAHRLEFDGAGREVRGKTPIEDVLKKFVA